MRIGTTLIAVAAVFALGACGRDADAPPEEVEPVTATGGPAEQTYAAELGVDLAAMTRSPSGLYTRDLAGGAGEPAAPGNHVVVHYTGWLPDGREFDSSRGRAPFDFALGEGVVIPGWDEGVAGMRPGGRRQLVIPPELAYGARGSGGVIPPNATLVFDVELLEVR